MEYARVTRDFGQPADRLWAILREFGDIAGWVAGVTASTLEDGADGVGAVRLVTLGERQVREKLLAIDDAGRRLRYAVLPPHGLPAEDVQSTILVAPIDRGHARVTWFSEAAMDGPDPVLTGRIEHFFAASLAQLDRLSTKGAA